MYKDPPLVTWMRILADKLCRPIRTCRHPHSKIILDGHGWTFPLQIALSLMYTDPPVVAWMRILLDKLSRHIRANFWVQPFVVLSGPPFSEETEVVLWARLCQNYSAVQLCHIWHNPLMPFFNSFTQQTRDNLVTLHACIVCPVMPGRWGTQRISQFMFPFVLNSHLFLTLLLDCSTCWWWMMQLLQAKAMHSSKSSPYTVQYTVT